MQKLFAVLFALCLFASSSFAAAFEVIDSVGRRVAFNEHPKRIVTTGRGAFMITNAAFLFESAKERLFAYSKTFQTKNPEGFYKLIDPYFANRQFTLNTTAIEELAAMKPDLILAKDYERSRLEMPLSQLGIRVVFLNLEDLDKFYSDIRIIGALFNEGARAEKIISFYDSWRRKIKNRLDSLSDSKKPRALITYYSESGSTAFNVSPKDWAQALLIREAGGEPVWVNQSFGSGWQRVSFDQIAAWQPDYIFVTSYFCDVEVSVKKIKNNLLWRHLSAVKNGRLFAFPEEFSCWDQPDSRWILGLCWLAYRLHPQCTELKSDLCELFGDFFSLYGISEADLSKIKVKGDYP